MFNKQNIGWMYLCILSSSAILPVLCYPSLSEGSKKPSSFIVLPEGEHDTASARKYAEKPNATKKVQTQIDDRNDLDDIQTNQIQTDNGFSWGNIISTLMQLFFSQAQSVTGPSKSDAIDTDHPINQSPWANLFTMGLKILSAFLTGGANVGSDGIDKVDNSSPMQGILTMVLSTVLGTKDQDQAALMAKQAGEFINIVVNLLDALKTSFSQRSTHARSLGKKDSIAEAGLAGIAMLKGYLRSMKTTNDACIQQYVCDAYRECTNDLNSPNATYCQLGTYATSAALHKSTGVPLESIYSATRTGKSGKNCRQAYPTCNEA